MVSCVCTPRSVPCTSVCACGYVCALVWLCSCVWPVRRVQQPVCPALAVQTLLSTSLPSQSLSSPPLLQKVLRSCSVLGILSDKPRHSQHGRCPYLHIIPISQTRRQRLREGELPPSRSGRARTWTLVVHGSAFTSEQSEQLPTCTRAGAPVRAPLSATKQALSTGGLHGGREGLPCTWQAGEVVVSA